MKDLFIKSFQHYKDLGDKTIAQLSDNELNWTFNSESNSVTTIIKHLSCHMNSRWTSFLTKEGEKVCYDRDEEFINTKISKVEIIDLWEKSWSVLFDALKSIDNEEWNKTILVNSEKLSLFDAVVRQLTHYSYHIGQLIYIAKMQKNAQWKTLYIEKDQSKVL